MKQIDLNEIASLEADYLSNDKARAVRHALTRNDIYEISRVQEAVVNNPNYFSIDLKTMPVTNQLQSGRCWIFSSMNVLREMIGRKYHIKEFELSQNYIAFYDKLEKANWFMNCIMAEKEQPLDSETNRFLLENAVSDGGQWNMLVSLVKKYGICPKTAMPETYQSSHTARMNAILNRRLRKFAADIRHMNDEETEQYRKQTLKEVYSLIASCFGVPPKTFDFVYYDDKDAYHCEHNVTPLSFYHDYLAVDLNDYVNVIHAPTEDKPYHRAFTVKYLGNVVNGEAVKMLNVTMDEFKEAIIAQLKDGMPVWFGCDCAPDSDRTRGLWDDGANDYAFTFDMDLDMSKADMLDSRQSAMNHAMVLTGVNLEDGKPTRWKIENSWGDKAGNKGYYTASDSWFEKYMYAAAVNRKYLKEEALRGLDQEVIELKPWDPFGTLAD
jgi:bleomycin hydrolase